MSRYIDVDALIENFTTATKAFMTYKYFFNVKEITAYMELIGKIIMSQPTADVVEVVRCKDCKHFEKERQEHGGDLQHELRYLP